MKNLSTLSLALVFTTDLITVGEVQFTAEIAYSITQLGLDTKEVNNIVKHDPEVMGITKLIYKGQELEKLDIIGRLQFIEDHKEQGIIIGKQLDTAARKWGKENIDNKQIIDAYIKLQYQIQDFPFDHYMGPKTYEETKTQESPMEAIAKDIKEGTFNNGDKSMKSEEQYKETNRLQ